MNNGHITIETRIDKHVFCAFSHFNAFHLHHRWLGLAAFPVIMLALGIVNRYTGSNLLFYLFSVVGILFPVLYLVFYVVSLSHQVRANRLETPRLAYTIALSESGIEVASDTEHAVYPWQQIYRFYVLPGVAYGYITKGRAFLLPFAGLREGATADELVACVRANLPPERLFDKRGGRVAL
ncbi:MAG: YcxB family protein [Lawsonibacter sp.]|nr:YcxB family protein [Lawsonibacter sp.]